MATRTGGMRRAVRTALCPADWSVWIARDNFFMPRQQFYYLEIITILLDVLDAPAGFGLNAQPPRGGPRPAAHAFRLRALRSLNLPTWLWGFVTWQMCLYFGIGKKKWAPRSDLDTGFGKTRAGPFAVFINAERPGTPRCLFGGHEPSFPFSHSFKKQISCGRNFSVMIGVSYCSLLGL